MSTNVNDRKKGLLFFERQFMPTWALFIMVGVGVVMPGIVLIASHKLPPFMIFLLFILLLGLALFMTMQTKVRHDEIEISFGLLPVIRYRYGLHMIKEFAVRKYSPVNEYGGWGIKGSKLNRALNMRGNLGVQMQMISKENTPWKLLIGSGRPEELAQAITLAKQ